MKRGVARAETGYVWTEEYFPWYTHHETADAYDQMKAHNVEVVRLAVNKVFWDANPSLRDWKNYVWQPYRDIIDSIVKWTSERNMEVILEGFIVTGQPAKTFIYINPTEWINWMVGLAERYKSFNNVSFNLMNEPPSAGWVPPPYNDPETLKARWIQIVSQFIEQVRAIKPYATVYVDTPPWNLTPFWQGNLLPYRNVVYAAHTYYHSELQYNEKYAIEYSQGLLGQAKIDFEQWLLNNSGFAMRKWTDAHGFPVRVCVTEIGVVSGPEGDPNWDVQIKDFYDLCRKHDVDWIQWFYHGMESPEPEGGYPVVHYHLFKWVPGKTQWTVFTEIGEVWAEEMKLTPTPPIAIIPVITTTAGLILIGVAIS